MGGGGSSSKNYTTNNLDVNPVTNIDFDVESIAEAMQRATDTTISIEEVKNKIAIANLKVQDDKNKIEAIKISNDEQNNKDLLKGGLIAVAVGGYFIYKTIKKGKK